MNPTTIRAYREADRAAVNAVALAAFAQYAGDYDDWPTFSAGIGRMADLAADGDLFVAERGGVIAGPSCTWDPDGRAARSFRATGR
ncbi:hypothetical protein P0M04_31740 [Telluria mixta]|uniref:hypothetical protein n=1 Tax=Telluria mixta TaxID=34071 RepID=UPI00247A25FB|nr:hypothetical protein [Telluria mixta]WEM95975.1 hypothetical protein P0M04_31740 [Telluria mixta]